MKKILFLVALSLSACNAQHSCHANIDAGHDANIAAIDSQHASATTNSAPVAENELSLYRLNGAWRDQRDTTFDFAALRGGPVVVAMFYGSCKTMCPALLKDIGNIDHALSPADRARTNYVLVTFDGANDTPEVRRKLASEFQLDPSRTHLISGSDRDVRVLANVLGVQYRRISNGVFAHNAMIHLLDAQGVDVMHLEGLMQPAGEFVARIHQIVRE